MGTDISYGLMVPATKGTGRTIKPMGMESLFTQTVMFTRANGLMTRRMAKELTHMLTVRIIMVIGSMISSTDGAWNRGLMVPSMKDSI